MITCRKIFSDIPFAHRQHLHDGHCALVHGHNWAIALTFACRETDDNGFVVDFGSLDYLKDWIDTHLDHAMVFSEKDPSKATLLAAADVWRPYTVPNASCEGLAEHFYEIFNPMVRENTMGRAWITRVDVHEDSRNSATYQPSKPDDCPYRDIATR